MSSSYICTVAVAGLDLVWFWFSVHFCMFFLTCVQFVCFVVRFLFFCAFFLFVFSLVVITDAVNCLERLFSDMTYYLWSRTLNSTH